MLLVWCHLLTIIKLKEITFLKTANDKVSEININSYSKSINSSNSDNSNSSDNISENIIFTLYTIMSSNYKIISESYLIIFKILIRILLILTSVLKTFINENEK